MPPPCMLTFDLLTFKVVSESRVTWATSVSISVFLGLFVLDLGLMYATDVRSQKNNQKKNRQKNRQTSEEAHHRLMPPLWGGTAGA